MGRALRVWRACSGVFFDGRKRQACLHRRKLHEALQAHGSCGGSGITYLESAKSSLRARFVCIKGMNTLLL